MKRFRRWVAILAVMGLVVAVAGFLFLHTGTVRSRALTYAIRELESRFNLTLSASDLRYNLFTRRASLSGIRLSARGRATEPFFTAREVRVELPLAAFRGRLAFDRIEVDEGRVDVVRDARGVSNLPGGGGGAPPATARRLTVHGLLVGNLDFTLDDQQHDVAIAARGIAADLKPGGPLGDISGRFAVGSGVTVRWREHTLHLAPVDSVLGFDGSSVALKDLPLDAREMRMRIGGAIHRVLDAPELELTLAGAANLAPATEWIVSPVPVSGSADLAGTMTGPPSAFTLALAVNGRGLHIGRETDVAVAGPVRLTPDRLTSDGLTVSPVRGGSIRASLDVPFGDGDARIKAALSDLDARSGVALANLDPPAIGAALSGDLDFTPGDRMRLAFSTTIAAKPAPGVTAVGGTASGGIDDGRWTLTHNLTMPGAAAAGQASGRFDREKPSRSTLGGGSAVSVSDIGAATSALAPLGIAVPAFVRELAGEVKAPARFAGTFDDPHITTSVEADQLQVPSLGRLDVGADIDITPRLVTIAPLFASRFSTVANGQVTVNLETKALGGVVRVMSTNAADLQTAVPLEWQLEGPLTAVATLGGTTANPTVEVEAEGQTNRWAGQAIDAVNARVRLTADGAQIHAVQLQQGSGRVEASGSYAWDGGAYTATADGKGLSWTGRLVGDTESRVTLSAHFEGAGTIDRPAGEARAEFDLTGGAAGDLVGTGTVDAILDGQDARIRAVVPSLGALVTGTIGLASPLPYRLVGVLNRVDLARLVPLTGITREVLEGELSLSATATGAITGDAAPEVFANLQTLTATAGDVPIALSTPARIGWKDDELTVTGLDAAVGKGRARASGTWATRTGTRFEGSYEGELGDVLQVARVFDLPADITGEGRVNVAVQSSGDPSTSSATLVLEKGRITWGDQPPVSDLQIQAALSNQALSISHLSGSIVSDQISGAFSASGRATVPGFDLAAIDGELVFDRASFDVARIPVDQQRPTRISLRRGRLGAEDVEWSIGGTPLALTGTVEVAGDTAFDLTVKGATDIRVLSAFVPAVGFDGTADIDVHVGGTPAQPALDGRINLTDAEVALPNPRAVIGDLSGPILLKGNRITIPAMHGSANGGEVSVEGSLALEGRELTGEINAQATGVAVEFPRGLRSEADFILTFRPGPGTPTLTGDVRVQRASYNETISLASLARNRTVAAPRLGAAAGPSFADTIALNIAIATVEDMVVDNNYGRFDTGASVRLVGTVAAPGLTGRVSLREGGEVYLAGRTFKINRGDISFTELSRIAPEFDIEAQAHVGRDDLTMRLTGTVEKPEFELSSSSRDKTGEELASSLIGGTNTGQSALTLLSADLLGVTGRALRLDTLRIERVDTFDPDFREDPTLIANDADPATRLTISKRLRDDIEVTVSQNLKENGKTTVIVSYYLLPQFEIRGISKDDAEFGVGIRHQLSFGGPLAAAAAERPAPTLVTAITFVGDAAPLQEAELGKRLRLEAGEPFNFYDWQRDIDGIREAYVAQGRYEARVRSRRVAAADAGAITLEYRLEPGPRTEIEIRGLEVPAAERRAMTESWTRAVFDRFLMDDLEGRLRRYLVANGYVEGTVEGRLTEADGVKRALLIVDPGPRVGGRAIVFSGNTAIGAGSLGGAVAAAGLEVDGWLDPQQLVPALQAFYRDHGFLSARVTPGVPHAEGDRGILPVTIAEGPGATVSEITLSGVAEARTADMRATVGLTSPMPYDATRVLEARNRLERAYRLRGFNAVQVSTDSKADAAGMTITLVFLVEEGPQQILREVATSGATRTREGVLSRALDLEIGAPVNLEEWARARKRLYDTNVFRQVDVVAEPTAEASGGIQPVRARVTVVEYPVWRLRYGLQLEGDREAFSDGSVGADELGVVAEVKNQNLLGRAVTGGVFGRYERLAQDGTVFASNASFFGLPIRSSVFGFFTRDKFRGDPDDSSRVIFITDRIGASFEQRVRRRFGIEFSYAYRYETNHTYDPEPSAGDEFPLNVHANIGRLSSAVLVDRRSDLLDARTGTFTAVSVEHAAGWLGSDAEYTKALAQQQLFLSPIGRLVLASRWQLGQTWQPENLLPVDRFRAGGATTVRGYPENSLGPYDFFGLPKGGGQLVILNQEVRFPLRGWFGGVGFVDAGNVFDQTYTFSWRELKVGYGIGLRVASPVGMLRLDFGIPGSSVAGLPALAPNSFAAGRWYFGLGHVF